MERGEPSDRCLIGPITCANQGRPSRSISSVRLHLKKKQIRVVHEREMQSGLLDCAGIQITYVASRVEPMSACSPRDAFWLVIAANRVVPRGYIFSFCDFTPCFEFFFRKHPPEIHSFLLFSKIVFNFIHKSIFPQKFHKIKKLKLFSYIILLIVKLFRTKFSRSGVTALPSARKL